MLGRKSCVQKYLPFATLKFSTGTFVNVEIIQPRFIDPWCFHLELVRGDPPGPHEELEDDLAVVLVQPVRQQGLGVLALLLLEVVGQQAVK